MSSTSGSCSLTSKYANLTSEDSSYMNNPHSLILNVNLKNDTSDSKNFIQIIVEEIFQIAMNVATKSNESKLSNITEKRVCENLCKNLKIITFTDDTKLLNDLESEIACERTMNDNSPNENDEVSNMNIKKNESPANDKPSRLDIEMKRFLDEFMHSRDNSNSNSSPDSIPSQIQKSDGTGDQKITTGNVVTNESTEECTGPVGKVVEKKSRVTDLVINSKKILKDIFLSDDNKKLQDDWEESKECVVQVINLECVMPEDGLKLMEKMQPTAANVSHPKLPETILEKDDDQDVEHILETITDQLCKSDEHSLQTIELSGQSDEKRSTLTRFVDCINNFKDRCDHGVTSTAGAKGDETKTNMFKSINLLARSSRSLPTSSMESEDEQKDNVADRAGKKTKKWNFGTKFLGFMKKHTLKNKGQNQNKTCSEKKTKQPTELLSDAIAIPQSECNAEDALSGSRSE